MGNLNLLIAKIVTRLDPFGEPIFMSELVDLKSLSGWSKHFENGQNPKFANVVDQLLQTEALSEYASMPGLEPLEQVRRHWEDLVRQGDRYFTQEPDAGAMDPITRSLCLRLAVKRVLDEIKQRDGDAA